MRSLDKRCYKKYQLLIALCPLEDFKSHISLNHGSLLNEDCYLCNHAVVGFVISETDVRVSHPYLQTNLKSQLISPDFTNKTWKQHTTNSVYSLCRFLQILLTFCFKSTTLCLFPGRSKLIWSRFLLCFVSSPPFWIEPLQEEVKGMEKGYELTEIFNFSDYQAVDYTQYNGIIKPTWSCMNSEKSVSSEHLHGCEPLCNAITFPLAAFTSYRVETGKTLSRHPKPVLFHFFFKEFSDFLQLWQKPATFFWDPRNLLTITLHMTSQTL